MLALLWQTIRTPQSSILLDDAKNTGSYHPRTASAQWKWMEASAYTVIHSQWYGVSWTASICLHSVPSTLFCSFGLSEREHSSPVREHTKIRSGRPMSHVYGKPVRDLPFILVFLYTLIKLGKQSRKPFHYNTIGMKQHFAFRFKNIRWLLVVLLGLTPSEKMPARKGHEQAFQMKSPTILILTLARLRLRRTHILAPWYSHAWDCFGWLRKKCP